jgi:hypothetical protein
MSFLIFSLLILLSPISAFPSARLNNRAAAGTPQAVYFLTNDACNSVVALKVNCDGTLSDGSITSTGGAGGNGFDAANNKSSAPDALFSQGALKVDGNVRVFIFPFRLVANFNAW